LLIALGSAKSGKLEVKILIFSFKQFKALSPFLGKKNNMAIKICSKNDNISHALIKYLNRKTYEGNGGLAPTVTLGKRWGIWSASSVARFYPREMRPQYLLTMRLGGTQNKCHCY
jgi:hypothetical protein